MPTAGATTPVKGQRKTKVGRVVSDKMDKTIVVSVERLTRHRLYKRVMKASTKFAAHDERNEAKIGDTVLIEESRPLSATKRWRLVSVLSRAGEERAAAEAIVAEEPETTEAIHAAAHPGKQADGDAGAAAEEGQA
jgi:small subunit ribosomal protein S17